jgi:hypothetical protein
MRSQKVTDQELLGKLLQSVLSFMKQSGMNSRQLEDSFAKAMFDIGKSSGFPGNAAPTPGDETVESGVIRLWHRNSRYLNDDAHPIPIRLYGKAPSVESLVRVQRTRVDPRLVIRRLKAAGFIRRRSSGLYVPVGDMPTIGRLRDEYSVSYVGKAVMRLLGTFFHNTGGKRVRLIERTARVPDLDAREAKAFVDFTRRQGLAYLQAVDDWLETRRIASKSKGKPRPSITGAGVHLFAYIGDEVDDELSPSRGVPGAGSSPRLSLAGPSGNRRVSAPCTTSGVAA